MGSTTMASLLVLLSVFFFLPIASSSKTPVATCCPPGSFLAIEDLQGSRQLPNGLWVKSEGTQHLASPTWETDEDYGRHNHISKVFCVPDKNNLPPIDGFAGSSYPDPPYFASVEDKLAGRETGNGTKPLANDQILQSTGDRFPTCPGGANELATIILGDGRSSRDSRELGSPLLRINEEGKLVGRHLSIFGSTDRLRQVLYFPDGCETEECSQETELGVDFCLTWSTDPRTQLVQSGPLVGRNNEATTSVPDYGEYDGKDEDARRKEVEDEFIESGPMHLLEAVYCDPCKGKVVCYYLIANWWAPWGFCKLNPVFWDNFGSHGVEWWYYPLLSYLDVDMDGKVSIQEFYDLKTVQILKVIFDGLDVNGDGFVKQNEARLESFLQHRFLRNITKELFDYVDINNDNQISVADYPEQCRPGGPPICMRIPPLENRIEEKCHLLASPFDRVCTTLITTYFSPDFDRIDSIHVNLEDLQEQVIRIFQFFAGGRDRADSQVGLKELVEGLARLGEPPQVIHSLIQHLTPIVNTFPRMILQSLVKSADKNLDRAMDWQEFEGFGDFELVFKRWPRMWQILQDDLLAGMNACGGGRDGKCFPSPWTTEDLKRYFSKYEVIIRLIHNLFYHEDL